MGPDAAPAGGESAVPSSPSEEPFSPAAPPRLQPPSSKAPAASSAPSFRLFFWSCCCFSAPISASTEKACALRLSMLHGEPLRFSAIPAARRPPLAHIHKLRHTHTLALLPLPKSERLSGPPAGPDLPSSPPGQKQIWRFLSRACVGIPGTSDAPAKFPSLGLSRALSVMDSFAPTPSTSSCSSKICLDWCARED